MTNLLATILWIVTTNEWSEPPHNVYFDGGQFRSLVGPRTDYETCTVSSNKTLSIKGYTNIVLETVPFLELKRKILPPKKEYGPVEATPITTITCTNFVLTTNTFLMTPAYTNWLSKEINRMILKEVNETEKP